MRIYIYVYMHLKILMSCQGVSEMSLSLSLYIYIYIYQEHGTVTLAINEAPTASCKQRLSPEACPRRISWRPSSAICSSSASFGSDGSSGDADSPKRPTKPIPRRPPFLKDQITLNRVYGPYPMLGLCNRIRYVYSVGHLVLEVCVPG